MPFLLLLPNLLSTLRGQSRYYMKKHCSKCNKLFDCCVNDITNCQCYNIALSQQAKTFIANNYNDCLCAECLKEIETINFKNEIQANPYVE